MKKNLILLLMIIFIHNPVLAKTYKLVGETILPFSTQSPGEAFNVRITKDYVFENGEKLEKGSLVNGSVIKVFKAKRGKLNAYFNIRITDFTMPSHPEKIMVTNDKAIAKITKYKESEIDVTNTALDAGTMVAGFFVKNISYPINFARGVIYPEGDSPRIKSGFKNMYKKSAFAYIEKGQDIDVKPGDLVFLTVKDAKKPSKGASSFANVPTRAAQ